MKTAFKGEDSINFKLMELCKYQQSIIERYKEYIEKHICQKIIEKTQGQDELFKPMTTWYQEITIPESRIVMRMDPAVLAEWRFLQWDTPLISPSYFVAMACAEQAEKEKESKDNNATETN